MDSRHFEKILQWVKKYREKYIIIFDDGSEPVVLLPFANLEEFYEKKEQIPAQFSTLRESFSQSKKNSLTEENSLDTITPERIQEKQSLEAPPKPQLLKEAIEERIRGEKRIFFNQNLSHNSLEEKKEEEKTTRVSEQDRYYFEPIE